MKNNITLILVLIVFAICSCEKNDENSEEKENTKISLSDSIINMNVGNDSYLYVKGADLIDCKIYSDNEFIAYANYSNDRIIIYGDHVGFTNIKVVYEGITYTCKVKVCHLTNYIGSTVTSFGVNRKTLFSLIKEYGLSGTYSTYKPNIINTTEKFSFGYVDTHYYLKNDLLYSIMKEITINDNDYYAKTNILSSLQEEFRYQTSYSETKTDIYPINYVSADIFMQPSISYAVYEQIKYGEIYTGYSLKTSNCIYISKDLDIAKNHTFVNSSY